MNYDDWKLATPPEYEEDEADLDAIDREIDALEDTERDRDADNELDKYKERRLEQAREAAKAHRSPVLACVVCHCKLASNSALYCSRCISGLGAPPEAK